MSFPPPSRPMRVLVVCTHNRTRSVIAGALLGGHMVRRGVDGVVRTAGTEAGGHPPTDRAARMLRSRGYDVSAHRSTRLGTKLVAGADLVITAESAHVAWIAGQWPEVFDRTFTLPELVVLGEAVGARAGRPVALWLAEVARRRPPASAYLDRDTVPEVGDPTGGVPRVWDASFAEIDNLTARLAVLLT